MAINWALLAAYIVAILVEIGGPVVLGIWLMRKYKSEWIVLATGVLSFSIAQLIHIPALAGVKALFSNGTLPSPSAQWVALVNGLAIGLLAAVCQESIRWIGLRLNAKNVKPFRGSQIFATGQGGAELLVLGGLLAYNLATVLFYNPGAQIAKGATTATVQSALAQIASYWTTPWYYGVLGLFEHIVGFTSQVVFTIFIWKSVARHQPLYFLAAFFYHILTDGMTPFLSNLKWGLWEIEGVTAIFLLINILVIYFTWTDEGGLDAEYVDDDEEEEEEGDEADEDEDSDDEEESEEEADEEETSEEEADEEETSEEEEK